MMLRNEIAIKERRQKLEVPDIAGNQGYPPIFEMSKTEARAKQIKDNDYIAAELKKQIGDQKEEVKRAKRVESEHAQKFLSGWGRLRDVQGTHFATSGNLGKMDGPSRQFCQ